MARYVDTKQGKDDVRDMEMLYNEHIARLGYQNRGDLATLYKEQRDRLSTALKEDVVPVTHAHWVVLPEGSFYHECSNCGLHDFWNTSYGEFLLPDYCPNCGAIMDEDSKE